MTSAADVRAAERVIDASGLVSRIEDCIAAHQARPGRPRELSVRTLFIALLLLAPTGRMHLIRVPAMLNGLDEPTRKRLGVRREAGVTRRQVERLYNLIAAALQSSASETNRFSGFDDLCDLLLAATIDTTCENTTSIAIDGTTIDSWGTRRKIIDRHGEIHARPTDPDAAWRGQDSTASWKRPVFGYELTVAVTISDLHGPDIPLAARVMRLRPATTEVKAMGLEVIRKTAEIQGTLGDVIADRGYTSSIDAKDFVLPIRALGGEPIFDLTLNQTGARGTTHGAVMIDGHPFSPSIPPALQRLVQPGPTAPWSELAAYRKKIEDRAKYAFVPHGSRKANGAQVFQCPASAGKLACPLMPAPTKRTTTKPSAKKPFPAVLAPATVAPGSVCSKKFTTFQVDDAPLAQRELYGTYAWADSMQRRSRVEGFFGNLKDGARENIRRGTIRMRGLIKSGILLAFAVASTNLRLATTFANRAPKPARKRTGRPRNTGVVKYADVFAPSTPSNAPPAVA